MGEGRLGTEIVDVVGEQLGLYVGGDQDGDKRHGRNSFVQNLLISTIFPVQVLMTSYSTFSS